MRTSEAASGLGEFGAQHRPSAAISQNRPGTQGKRRFREAAKIKAPQIAAAAKCACCTGEFRRKWSWQKCCSRECQLIYLAARKVLEAYRAGRGDGLRDIIRRIK